MKPLQPIALGLLVVVVTAALHGYDLLANPLGWLLVMVGVRDLPAELERRSLTVTLGWTATIVSFPLWIPAVSHAISRADPSQALNWALSLPSAAFGALLCHGLSQAAGAARARLPASLFRFGVTANIIVALLPIPVFAADMGSLASPAATAAALTTLGVLALCFMYADRPWAMSPLRDQPPAVTSD